MKINNTLNQLFAKREKDILSLFCTAEYPKKGSTETLLKLLSATEVDMIELGIPFSDPVADGSTIQDANNIALSNGANLNQVFDSLSKFELKNAPPILLMGYLNPFLQYGIEKLCKDSQKAGVVGLIIPDLPPDIFELKYQYLAEQYKVHFIHLIGPSTSSERIKMIDELSSGFIYAVSSNSTTGNDVKGNNEAFLNRIQSLQLKNKIIIGFNIRSNDDFKRACQYGNGAIIGSQFIRHLRDNGLTQMSVDQFVNSIKYAQKTTV